MRKYLFGIIGAAALIALCVALVGTVKSNLEKRLAVQVQYPAVLDDSSKPSKNSEVSSVNSQDKNEEAEKPESSTESSENKKNPAGRQDIPEIRDGKERPDKQIQEEKPVNTAASVIKVPDYYDQLKKHGIELSNVYWCDGHWYYTVQLPDTIESICEAFDTDEDSLLSVNSGVDDESLTVGQIIMIPD